MSLITRCTACETLFRVVPDQLRISDGWVRCGQCGEIFDAARNLVEGPWDEDSREPAPEQTSDVDDRGTATAAAPPPPAPANADTAPAVDPAADLADPDSRTGAGNGPESAAASVEEASDTETETKTAAADGITRAPAQARGDEPVETADEPASPAVPPARAPSQTAWPDGMVLDGASPADPAAPQPSFLRARDTPSPWHRPAVRWTLGLLCLMLLVVLAAQVLRHERDRLAVMAPGLRPTLALLCQWTRCRIDAPRQIDAVVIDSSSFARLRGDVYRLAFSLRNAAPFDLAMPSIELSVTDAQDQAVARRVLHPADFGAGGTVLGAGSEWSTRVTLSVRTAATDRVAGYRMLAFYP